MATLGVNIDHIANVREARKTIEPDPVQFAFLAELGGADSITVHLREDRRHINERDVYLLRKTIKTKLNLEMAATEEMLDIAKKVLPDYVTLVPEKREEITTEGGLDIEAKKEYLSDFVKELRISNIGISAFIDPNTTQIEFSKEIGFDFVELHTGTYSELKGKAQENELQKLIEASFLASDLGLIVNAGHGLTYQNVLRIASIYNIKELNIGHSIVSRALAVGLEKAVREMKNLISKKN
ncbi:MAG: pyridoxine 5'-phosphate synthase [Prochlorococcus sp. SP3034]|nr:pyridoxine 5'-phosphate synthase [Prochlorococcus sp. SP3034]|tara:strand:- start:5269 stop:5988 length:720 start_codon:yes stop_codon:yes gene_type:complete